MKKTIRDSVFADVPVTVREESIEIDSLVVSKDGLRSMTIEEQVARLRERIKRTEEQRDSWEDSARVSLARMDELEDKIAAMRKRARSKR